MVAQSIDGYFVGFELSACAFEPFSTRSSRRRTSTRCARGAPPDPDAEEVIKKIDWHDYETRVLNCTCSRSRTLAWKHGDPLRRSGGILSVTEPLDVVFLALILLAGALVAASGTPIRTVSIEARLSRLKTDFVSSVSHDLRTPSRRSACSPRLCCWIGPARKRRSASPAKSSPDETDRLSRLTERILDFSRMEAGRKAYQFSNADIRELVSKTM